MRFEFNINVNLSGQPDKLDSLISLVKEIQNDMALDKSTFLAAIAASQQNVKDHVTKTSADVTQEVNDLTAQIADLKTKVGQVLTQADLDPILAANQDVVDAVDKLDPTAPAPTPVTAQSIFERGSLARLWAAGWSPFFLPILTHFGPFESMMTHFPVKFCLQNIHNKA